MAHLDYLDFDIEIGPGQGRDYPLALRSSPGGEAQEVLHFPFDELALERYQDKLKIVLLSAEGKGRGYLSDEERAVREFGAALFECLLCGEMRSRYEVSLDRAAQQGKGLRLRLHIAAPELAALPWELLYDPRREDYVCLSTNTQLVRYFNLPRPGRSLDIQPPLRILAMIASPRSPGTPPLDVASEKMRLERALAGLKQRGLVEIHWLESGTWHDLQRWMRRGPWHIFHFIGHGRYDSFQQEGQLALVGEDGGPQPLAASELTLLLKDHSSLSLVVLNACEGGRGGHYDIFSSTAGALVQGGLPAVLSMQYAIRDRAAIELAQAFYESLADGLPVDAAVAEGRKAMRLARRGSLEWGTPVLHMRSPDGVLFRMGAAPTGPPVSLGGAAPPAQVETVSRTGPASAVRPPGAVKPEAAVPTAARARSRPTPAARSVPPPLLWHDPRLRRAAAWGAAGAVLLLLLVGLANGIGKIWQSWSAGAAQTQQTSMPLALTQAVNATRTAQAKIALTPTREPSPTPLPALWEDAFGVPMALIPAGEFQMGSETGSADERPVHTVSLDAFYMDIYEVTNARYTVCVQAGGCESPVDTKSYTHSSYYGSSQYADYPVIYVTWEMANTYCTWRGARLPGEAEWEKAARGGLTGKAYPWGDDAPVCQSGADNGANYDACSPDDTMAVGSFAPNGYGLYDMAGNVWEWVMDWYSETYYASSPDKNPTGPESGDYRVLRGGSWDYLGPLLRPANRYRDTPDDRNNDVGFRCARSP